MDDSKFSLMAKSWNCFAWLKPESEAERHLDDFIKFLQEYYEFTSNGINKTTQQRH